MELNQQIDVYDLDDSILPGRQQQPSQMEMIKKGKIVHNKKFEQINKQN